MYKIVGLAIAAACAFAAAPASAEFKEDTTQITNFDGKDVGLVLDQLGAKWTMQKTDDGTQFYQINFSNGYVGFAAPAACGSDDGKSECMGLLVFASFDKPDSITKDQLKERVNQFNIDYSPTKGVVEDDGTASIIMYVMTDYGIARSNLYIQLQVFQDMMETFNSTLLGEKK